MVFNFLRMRASCFSLFLSDGLQEVTGEAHSFFFLCIPADLFIVVSSVVKFLLGIQLFSLVYCLEVSLFLRPILLKISSNISFTTLSTLCGVKQATFLGSPYLRK